MRGGSFNDLLTRPPLGISSRLGITIELRDSIASPSANRIVRWLILQASELRKQIVEEFEVSDGTESRFKAFVDVNTEPISFGRNHQVEFPNSAAAGIVDLEFEGLLPNLRSSFALKDPRFDVLHSLRDELTGTATAVQWLTSLRTTPKRSEPYSGAAPASLSATGERAFSALAYSEQLRAEVSEWFERNLSRRLVIVPMGEQFQVALETISGTPLRIPVVDVGEGLIQVLPVLVAAAMARFPASNGARILAIEEPESHLHPRFHAALAERFCALAALPTPPQTIVETHSELFLSEMQLQIAVGSLNPDRVIVYWVKSFEDGRARLDPVTFDAAGRPQSGTSLPRGVFAEDIAHAKKLFTQQQKHHKS